MKTRNRSAALPALSATALSVAIVLLALALPAAAVAAPSWLTPVDLSAGGQPAYDPQVAVDGDGNATAVWTRNNDSNNRIVQSAVRPAGGSWSAPVDVSIPGRNADAPQVAVDRKGNATAVWCRFESDSNVVQSAERAPGGSWSTPVTLSAPGMRADGRDVYCPAQVAVDEQGNATAVWDRTEGGQHFVQSAVRARGGSWSAPVDVSVPGPEAGDPQVAVDGQGNATAVWRRNNGSTYIVQSAVRPLGGSWSAPADLSSPSGFLGDKQQVAVDRQGNATAVWVVKPSLAANFVVQSAVRTPGGSWSAPIDISTVGGQFPSNPQVAVDGQGNATAVWERLDGASNSIVQSAVRAPGGSWSAPADLSAAGQDAADPQVAVDGQGNATAVWSRFDGSLVRVQGAVRATSGVWSAPADLSAAGHEGDCQQVAVDEKGNATVVWQRDEQDVEDPPVQAAGFDAAGPLLRFVQIPATGTVGQPLAFSVSPLDVWSALGATTWHYGDGATASGVSVTHTYTAPGPHTVTLTGSDALGNTSTLSRRVTVTAPTPAPPAPSNRFTASKPKVKGAKITFAVRLPGPGRLTVRAAYSVKRRQAGYASTSGTVTRGTRVIALKPSAAARKALKKLRRVKVTVTVRYIPTGGTARSATVGRVTIKGGKR